MKRYSLEIIEKARTLRTLGKTYTQINVILQTSIPKNSLSYWLSKVPLPKDYTNVIKKINTVSLQRARAFAAAAKAKKRKDFFYNLRVINTPIVKKLNDPRIAKIALAMLCLGEASKYNPKTTTGFYLGSSNPKIILLFINLLKQCFKFDVEKVRCTVQCRADQNVLALEKYWQEMTDIPKRLFYPSRIDPRTRGKPTVQSNYKGVLRVDYFDRKVQLELESLSDLVYNYVLSGLVA